MIGWNVTATFKSVDEILLCHQPIEGVISSFFHMLPLSGAEDLTPA